MCGSRWRKKEYTSVASRGLNICIVSKVREAAYQLQQSSSTHPPGPLTPELVKI